MRLKFYVSLCAFVMAFLLVNRASAQMKQVTIDQIKLLLQEKESRTPAQKKMSSQLLQGVRESRGQQMAAGVALAKVKLETNGANQVKVDIAADVSDALLAKITAMGGTVLYPSKQFHTLRAMVPLAKVEEIAGYSEVKFIEPAVMAHIVGAGNKPQNVAAKASAINGGGSSVIPSLVRKEETPRTKRLEKLKKKVQDYIMTLGTGTVTSLGDHEHRADDARNAFGYAGQGIKIGVLSDSYNAGGTAPASVLSGNLPGVGNPLGNTTPVTVVADYASGTDEGQAMLQIVHDLAPKAQLFFATADQSEAGFANNIIALRNTYGCDVIIDDVGYFDESPFSDGIVAQAVTTVTTAGAMYFSSAGNAGNLKDGTASNYEADFNDVGSPAFTGSTKTGTIHNFGTAGSPINGDIITAAQTTTGTNYYSLFWADPYGKSNNDYDLFLVSSTGTVKASATTTQNGTQNAYEIISTSATFAAGDRLVVFKAATAAVRAFHITTNNDASSYLQIGTTGATYGHNCAIGGFCVAAVPAPPSGGNPFLATAKAETFSSDGPRRMFFNKDSTPVTPGSFTFASGGYQTRQKPDITAADGVATSLPSFNLFYGTSAAAPHAGSIAALLLCANKTLATPKTTDQIRAILDSTALDIEDPKYDYLSGFGILQAFQAMTLLNPTPAPNISFGASTVTEGTFSNHDGVVEPGEIGNLAIQLNNLTPTTATNVSAVVTSSTVGVTIINGTASYGNIAGGGSVSNTATPFTFAVSPTIACGTTITFNVLATFGGGGPSPASSTISYVVGNFTTVASASTTLGSPTPTTTANRFVTGIQTGRLGRVTSGNSSSCAAPITTNPGLGATTGPRVYDEYVVKNTTGVSQCFIVTLNVPSSNALYVATYKTAYVPSNPSTNYVAEPAQTLPTLTLSATVAANDSMIVVVSAVDSTTGAANEAGTPYSLSVTYLNCGTTTTTCTPVVITKAVLPPGATGVYYDQHITVTGGSGAYVDSLTGALPAGLVFASDSLSGTPTQAGTFPITVKVVDPLGCPSATMTYNLVISGVLPASLKATAGTPQTTLPGQAFATALQATVKSAASAVLPGVNVIFTAPTTGATGTFAGGLSTVTVVTDANGLATAPAFTANTTNGTYKVYVTVAGVTPALIDSFILSNTCPPTIVTTGADNGVGSLRYIVANACSGAVITFDPSVTAVTLTSGEIPLTQPVTINGNGANVTSINGSNLSRIFLVTAPTTSAISISGLTLKNGMPQAAGVGSANSTNGGGAVLLTGSRSFTVNSCYFLNNNASLTSYGEGGAIDNETTDTLYVYNSGFTGNIATEDGGAIAQWGSKPAIISNCTFSANTTSTGGVTATGFDGWGGGILIANTTASGTAGGATLTNCTFYGNSATLGGNVFKYAGTFRLGNTVMGGGIATGTGATSSIGFGHDIFNNTGTITSNGYNLIQSANGSVDGYTLATANNITGTNPKLFALANYGGTMPTILPLSSSAAINGASPTAPTLTVDQRGFARVAGGRADIGAVETNYAATIAAGTPQVTAVGTTFPTALAATVTESGNLIAGDSVLFGAPATGASGTFASGLKTVTVATNASGVATATAFTANGTVGTYNDTASIGAAFTSLKYALTNRVATLPFAGCPNINLLIARPGYDVYNGEPLSLYTLDTAAGTATLLPGGPLKDFSTNRNIEVNGAGVNGMDGFIYAIRDTINTAGTSAAPMLYRIGYTYGNDMLGTLPTPAVSGGDNLSIVNPAAGSFDDAGNYYYIAMTGAYSFTSNSFTPSSYYIGKVSGVASLTPGTGALTATFTKIAFTGAPATFTTGIYRTITSASGAGAGTGFQDMAYSNMYKSLYVYSAYNTGSAYAGQLFAINPTTGATTFYANPPAFGAVNNEVAGISTTASGNLRVFMTSGDIYKPVMANNGDFTSTLTKVGTSGVPALGVTGSIRGDLASCGVGSTTLPSVRTSGITIGLPNQIIAYPNPAQGLTTITVGLPLTNATVRLLGATGNVITELNGVSGYTFQMDMSGKSGGMYTVEVIQGGNTQVVKIIKP